MRRNRPPSAQTTSVILAMAEAPADWQHGYDLCQQTGLKAGAMYPILIRLADRGFLETAWESEIPKGRPPRHLYRLTRAGAHLAKDLREKRMAEAAARMRLRPEGA